jgi:hypothetical protein
MMQYNDSQREQAMNHAKMMKQIINLQKKSFENCFSIMVTLQMQAENIFNFFHYLPIMSDEGKIFMKQRTDAYRKWIDDLRKAVNEGYAKIEALCDDDTMTAFRDQTEKIYQFYINQARIQNQHNIRLVNTRSFVDFIIVNARECSHRRSSSFRTETGKSLSVFTGSYCRDCQQLHRCHRPLATASMPSNFDHLFSSP